MTLRELNKMYNSKESNYRTSANITDDRLAKRVYATREDLRQLKELFTNSSYGKTLSRSEELEKYYEVYDKYEATLSQLNALKAKFDSITEESLDDGSLSIRNTIDASTNNWTYSSDVFSKKTCPLFREDTDKSKLYPISINLSSCKTFEKGIEFRFKFKTNSFADTLSTKIGIYINEIKLTEVLNSDINTNFNFISVNTETKKVVFGEAEITSDNIDSIIESINTTKKIELAFKHESYTGSNNLIFYVDDIEYVSDINKDPIIFSNIENIYRPKYGNPTVNYIFTDTIDLRELTADQLGDGYYADQTTDTIWTKKNGSLNEPYLKSPVMVAGYDKLSAPLSLKLSEESEKLVSLGLHYTRPNVSNSDVVTVYINNIPVFKDIGLLEDETGIIRHDAQIVISENNINLAAEEYIRTLFNETGNTPAAFFESINNTGVDNKKELEIQIKVDRTEGSSEEAYIELYGIDTTSSNQSIKVLVDDSAKIVTDEAYSEDKEKEFVGSINDTIEVEDLLSENDTRRFNIFIYDDKDNSFRTYLGKSSLSKVIDNEGDLSGFTDISRLVLRARDYTKLSFDVDIFGICKVMSENMTFQIKIYSRKISGEETELFSKFYNVETKKDHISIDIESLHDEMSDSYIIIDIIPNESYNSNKAEFLIKISNIKYNIGKSVAASIDDGNKFSFYNDSTESTSKQLFYKISMCDRISFNYKELGESKLRFFVDEHEIILDHSNRFGFIHKTINLNNFGNKSHLVKWVFDKPINNILDCAYIKNIEITEDKSEVDDETNINPLFDSTLDKMTWNLLSENAYKAFNDDIYKNSFRLISHDELTIYGFKKNLELDDKEHQNSYSVTTKTETSDKSIFFKRLCKGFSFDYMNMTTEDTEVYIDGILVDFESCVEKNVWKSFNIILEEAEHSIRIVYKSYFDASICNIAINRYSSAVAEITRNIDDRKLIRFNYLISDYEDAGNSIFNIYIDNTKISLTKNEESDILNEIIYKFNTSGPKKIKFEVIRDNYIENNKFNVILYNIMKDDYSSTFEFKPDDIYTKIIPSNIFTTLVALTSFYRNFEISVKDFELIYLYFYQKLEKGEEESILDLLNNNLTSSYRFDSIKLHYQVDPLDKEFSFEIGRLKLVHPIYFGTDKIANIDFIDNFDYYSKTGNGTYFNDVILPKLQVVYSETAIAILEKVNAKIKEVLEDFQNAYPDYRNDVKPVIEKYVNEKNSFDNLKINETGFQTISKKDNRVYKLIKIDPKKYNKIKALTQPNEVIDLVVNNSNGDNIAISTTTKDFNFRRDLFTNEPRSSFILKSKKSSIGSLNLVNVKSIYKEKGEIKSVNGNINNTEEPGGNEKDTLELCDEARSEVCGLTTTLIAHTANKLWPEKNVVLPEGMTEEDHNFIMRHDANMRFNIDGIQTSTTIIEIDD